MPEERETKSCQFCCETVDVRARICPHCRTQQTRWAWTFHPAVLALGWSLTIGALLVWDLAMGMATGLGPPAVEMPDGLRVVSSELVHDDSGEVAQVGVTGIIENTGKRRWRSVQVEVQYFDRDGKLVDVATDVPYRAGVGRHNKLGFAVWSRRHAKLEAYATHKVIVRSAEIDEGD